MLIEAIASIDYPKIRLAILGHGPLEIKLIKLIEHYKLQGQVNLLGYQKNILNHLLHYNTLQRISDSELYGNQYALSSVMRDLNDAIFKADIYGSVNSFRQNLQIEYTNSLIDILTGKQSDKYTNNAKSMALYNLNTIRTMAAPSGDIASRAHKQHLRTLIDNALKEVNFAISL